MKQNQKISLGAGPVFENLAQTKDDDYYKKASIQCTAYINQLWRYLTETFNLTKEIVPKSLSFEMESRYIDSEGGYGYEVVVKFSDDDNDAMELAYKLECLLPLSWDEEAIEELEKESEERNHYDS